MGLGRTLPEVRQENRPLGVAGATGSIPMKRVSAPERTRERLQAIIDGRLGTAPERSSLVLLAAQLILEEALEAEVRDEVGRERYERAGGAASGYRNGYRTGRMKTAEGMPLSGVTALLGSRCCCAIARTKSPGKSFSFLPRRF